jgi:hypothetical protein
MATILSPSIFGGTSDARKILIGHTDSISPPRVFNIEGQSAAEELLCDSSYKDA